MSQEPWEIEWRDYYAILQLNPSADGDVIGWTGKKLRSKYHTDRDTGDEVKIRLINEALSVLEVPKRKQRYDAVYQQRLNQPNEAEAALQRERELRAQAERTQKEEAERRQSLEQELASLRQTNIPPPPPFSPQTPPNPNSSSGVNQGHQPGTQFNISGDWLLNGVDWHRFWQNGNQIRVQAFDANGQVICDGNGIINGVYIQWRYQTVPLPTPPHGIPAVQQGEFNLQLHPDGTMQGQQTHFSTGYVVPAWFRR